MSTLAALLERFEAVLHGHVAQVLDVAAGSPAGGADRWDGILGVFGLCSLVPRESRGAAAAKRGQTRGALPEDVELVLARVAHDARQTLAGIQAAHAAELSADPGMRARFDGLAASIATLASTQRAAYEVSLRPPPSTGAGLAGIFANVRATAEINPWNRWRAERQITLQCAGCGAAQSAELVFTCKFCGNNLFGECAEP